VVARVGSSGLVAAPLLPTHRPPATAAPWSWPTRPGRPCGRAQPPSPARRRRCGRCAPAHPAGSPRPPPGFGSTAGGGCCPHPLTPTCAPSGWAVTLPATKLCRPTSPRWRPRSPGCWRPLMGRSSPACPGARWYGRPASPPTASPIARYPTAEQLYAATGLAPATYQSASLTRRGRISRQGLAEHRDALMGIAWGLSQHAPSFRQRDQELRARGMRPIQAGWRWPGTPAGSAMPC
jgi:hypothetical protein